LRLTPGCRLLSPLMLKALLLLPLPLQLRPCGR
jgi:hypothetical protein